MEIKRLEVICWNLLKDSSLEKYLRDETDNSQEKINDWKNYLIELENNSSSDWIKRPENQFIFLKTLENLIECGYQASDKIDFAIEIEDNGSKKVKSFYKTFNGSKFDTAIWEKERADYYASECQSLVGEIQDNLVKYPDWEQNINSVIGERRERDAEKTIEERIEEYIVLAMNQELVREKIDKIKKLAQEEIKKLNETEFEQTSTNDDEHVTPYIVNFGENSYSNDFVDQNKTEIDKANKIIIYIEKASFDLQIGFKNFANEVSEMINELDNELLPIGMKSIDLDLKHMKKS
ncbi:MAG: hypothetical protein mread185_000488 [Mycoplasmataceae bacterium]|nr:MAG: hypothetical protein mread185_000488 [Mycoplasmataceae bacterium]